MTIPELGVEVCIHRQRVQLVRLSETGVSIGRSPSNDVVLTHTKVSQRHAKLSVQDDRLLLVDLGSTHGTLIQGRRIDAAPIAPGDEFQIGPYVLKIVPYAPTLAETVLGSESGTSRERSFTHLIQSLLHLTDLVGVTDLQAVLETVLERAMELIGANRGFVVLPRGDNLSPVLARLGSAPDGDERFSQTVCQKAVTTRRPVWLSDVKDRLELVEIQSLVAVHPSLVVAIPLIDRGEVLGVLYLECDRTAPKTGNLQLVDEVSTLGGRALRTALTQHQIVSLHERWRWYGAAESDDIDIFRSCRNKGMKEVLATIRKASQEDVTMLILGESGTGKEMTALTVHRLSDRRNGPFLGVNCGAIPRDLMEAELFGYEKGAFTGATERKRGRLESAQGGTLLLDEIADLPKDLQVKLLRVLQTRSFERVGGSDSVRLDVRVIAATNRNLDEAVARGEFREDLYYRLNVIEVRLPSLRERVEDIGPLVQEMLVAANRLFKRKLYGVTPEALNALEAYRWPGNVRELRNVIERAFILETGDRITPESLPFSRTARAPSDLTVDQATTPTVEKPVLTLDQYLERQERDYVRVILGSSNGNISRAAKVLGLSRVTLHRKLHRLGLRGLFDPKS